MPIMDIKKSINFPENKEFLFSIFDDTDVSTLDNIKPVYDYLFSLGILTSKSVWPLQCRQKGSDFAGSQTLEERNYADYVIELSTRGFEITFHGASMESNLRNKTLKALDYFFNLLGYYPRAYACHADNRENIYWGEERFCYNIFRKLYRVLNKKEKDLCIKKNEIIFKGNAVFSI